MRNFDFFDKFETDFWGDFYNMNIEQRLFLASDWFIHLVIQNYFYWKLVGWYNHHQCCYNLYGELLPSKGRQIVHHNLGATDYLKHLVIGTIGDEFPIAMLWIGKCSCVGFFSWGYVYISVGIRGDPKPKNIEFATLSEKGGEGFTSSWLLTGCRERGGSGWRWSCQWCYCCPGGWSSKSFDEARLENLFRQRWLPAVLWAAQWGRQWTTRPPGRRRSGRAWSGTPPRAPSTLSRRTRPWG